MNNPKVEKINRIRHRKLVRGCFVASDDMEGHQYLLSYDYMQNGILDDHVFGTNHKVPLLWPQGKNDVLAGEVLNLDCRGESEIDDPLVIQDYLFIGSPEHVFMEGPMPMLYFSLDEIISRDGNKVLFTRNEEELKNKLSKESNFSPTSGLSF
ncbi:hypothetical protein SUGI_0911980 [Cryptomeria japonica]|nr:hypothetical protein SUGI_0911980 [Cryptomeria japonica]